MSSAALWNCQCGISTAIRPATSSAASPYDIDTVNASLSNDLLQVATSAITVVGSLVMMLAISPMLVLVFAVTIPISILFTRYMTRKVRPLFRKRSLKLGELNGFVEEIITGQKTIKAYHQEQTMTGRFDVKNKEAVDAYYNADYYGSMTGPSVNFINNLSLALISMFGALLFLFGGLGLGRAFLVCALFPQVFRADQRNRQHHQRTAVGLRGGGAGFPPHRRARRTGGPGRSGCAGRCPRRGGNGACPVRLSAG